MDTVRVREPMEHNKRYLLVIQDYFTKWVEAFPLPNEQAVTMARVTRRPALGRTVRIFNALSDVRRSGRRTQAGCVFVLFVRLVVFSSLLGLKSGVFHFC